MLSPDGHKEPPKFHDSIRCQSVEHQFNRLYDPRQVFRKLFTASGSTTGTKADLNPLEGAQPPQIRRRVSASLKATNETFLGQPPELSSGSASTPS